MDSGHKQDNLTLPRIPAMVWHLTNRKVHDKNYPRQRLCRRKEHKTGSSITFPFFHASLLLTNKKYNDILILHEWAAGCENAHNLVKRSLIRPLALNH